jgi:hypothetical protein
MNSGYRQVCTDIIPYFSGFVYTPDKIFSFLHFRNISDAEKEPIEKQTHAPDSVLWVCFLRGSGISL